MSTPAPSGELSAAAERRTAEIVTSLRALDDDGLLAPSALPGWSRLTVACHLRYGAEALGRMTAAALAGRPVAFYPGGRDRQRATTLSPGPGESPHQVVDALAEHSLGLHRQWAALNPAEWEVEVVEPDGMVDLGRLPLERLALLRLTEVEAHGSDLGLGLDDWSDLFVDVALPFRLDWLNTRRTNHRAVDAGLDGSWLLVADDGPAHLVVVEGGIVASHPASPESAARAAIHGSRRDLLALLLGRPSRRPLRFSGDAELGRAFGRAFPGP